MQPNRSSILTRLALVYSTFDWFFSSRYELLIFEAFSWSTNTKKVAFSISLP